MQITRQLQLSPARAGFGQITEVHSRNRQPGNVLIRASRRLTGSFPELGCVLAQIQVGNEPERMGGSVLEETIVR